MAKAFPEPAAPVARLSAPTRTGRYSKIQNSVITLHHSAGADDSFPLLCELQALARKDAATLATSLRLVANAACQARAGSAASGAGATRLVHCVVGDVVSANQLAARLLWRWMLRDGCLKYYLLVFTCSTHAANLCVRYAICADDHKSLKDGNAYGHPIVATSARLFKYLLPVYGLQIIVRLHLHVSKLASST